VPYILLPSNDEDSHQRMNKHGLHTGHAILQNLGEPCDVVAGGVAEETEMIRVRAPTRAEEAASIATLRTMIGPGKNVSFSPSPTICLAKDYPVMVTEQEADRFLDLLVPGADAVIVDVGEVFFGEMGPVRQYARVVQGLSLIQRLLPMVEIVPEVSRASPPEVMYAAGQAVSDLQVRAVLWSIPDADDETVEAFAAGIQRSVTVCDPGNPEEIEKV